MKIKIRKKYQKEWSNFVKKWPFYRYVSKLTRSTGFSNKNAIYRASGFSNFEFTENVLQSPIFKIKRSSKKHFAQNKIAEKRIESFFWIFGSNLFVEGVKVKKMWKNRKLGLRPPKKSCWSKKLKKRFLYVFQQYCSEQNKTDLKPLWQKLTSVGFFPWDLIFSLFSLLRRPLPWQPLVTEQNVPFKSCSIFIDL